MKAPQNVRLSGRISLQTAYPAFRSEWSALLACLSSPVQLDWRLGPTPMWSGRAAEEGDPCLDQELNGSRLACSWAHGAGNEPLFALLDTRNSAATTLFVLTDALLKIFRNEKTFTLRGSVKDFLTWAAIAANAHTQFGGTVARTQQTLHHQTLPTVRNCTLCFYSLRNRRGTSLQY